MISSQSAKCLLSSVRFFGGKWTGRVLLRTFSKVLGPVDFVGRCPIFFWNSACCSENVGEGAGPAEEGRDEEERGAGSEAAGVATLGVDEKAPVFGG